MVTDLKTLMTFTQHLRSHLSRPMIDVADMNIRLHTIRVFAFHEEQVWYANMTSQVTEGNKLYDVDAVHTFIMRTEMVETENGYVDKFDVYEDQEAVSITDKRFVKEINVRVAPEVAGLKTEKELIIPSAND